MRIIGLSGGSSGTRTEVANRLAAELRKRQRRDWAIINIDDVVAEHLVETVKGALDIDTPLIRNPYIINKFRETFSSVADDFWTGVISKKIQQLFAVGKRNFIITDINTRGEHKLLRTELHARMFFMHTEELISFNTYDPSTETFDGIIVIDDVEDIDDIIGTLVDLYLSLPKESKEVPQMVEDFEDEMLSDYEAMQAGEQGKDVMYG